MPKDIHAITGCFQGEHFVLLFDESNRHEMLKQVEEWSQQELAPADSQLLAELALQIHDAPCLDVDPAYENFRGGLAAIDNSTG